jgi:hypothetical protein
MGRLLGEEPNNLRQLRHATALGSVGSVTARETTYDLGDFALLKLAWRLRRGGRTVNDALQEAVGFAPHLVRIATGGGTAGAYALIGTAGDKSMSVVCEGRDELRRASLEALEAGASMLEVVDLAGLATEVFVEWACATGTGDQLRDDFLASADKLTPAERATMAKLIAEAQRKLAGIKITMPAATAAPTWAAEDLTSNIKVELVTADPATHGIVGQDGWLGLFAHGAGVRVRLDAAGWRALAQKAEAVADELDGRPRAARPTIQAEGEVAGNA